jgi:peptidoglycan hydrolase-like protein with peptidoglycan-binding domain
MRPFAWLLALFLAVSGAGAQPLGQGARGPWVAAVQAELGLPADAVYGPETAARVQTFQQHEGLAADGVVGPLTSAALLRPLLHSALLAPGAQGAAVTMVQQRLTALGFSPGAADGDFGPTTEAAVVAFQRARGLTPDGVVGQETLSALLDPIWTVAPGDTLSSLALRWDVPLRLLMATNGLQGDTITVGERLVIPVFPYGAAPKAAATTPAPAANPAPGHVTPGDLIPATALPRLDWSGGATPDVAVAVFIPQGKPLPVLSVPYTAFVTGLSAGLLPGTDVEVAAPSARAAARVAGALRRLGWHPRYLWPLGRQGAWVLQSPLTPILGLTPVARPTLSHLVGGEVLLLPDDAQALQAFARLLPQARALGYRFETVAQLYR